MQVIPSVYSVILAPVRQISPMVLPGTGRTGAVHHEPDLHLREMSTRDAYRSITGSLSPQRTDELENIGFGHTLNQMGDRYRKWADGPRMNCRGELVFTSPQWMKEP